MVAFIFLRLIVLVMSVGQKRKKKRQASHLLVDQHRVQEAHPNAVRSGAQPIHLTGSVLASAARTCCF